MGLVTLDLPTPAQLRGRWAAYAAIRAARGRDRTCWADVPVWHFDDSGGNWAEVHHLGAGRAVLIGYDHEYSETYYGPAAEEFGEDETDVLAGAPDWWRPVVERMLAEKEYVGFVYGFDGDGWKRADYSAEDGFRSVGLPALSLEKTRESIISVAREAPGLGGSAPSPAAIEALIAADGDVTEAHVTAVVGAGGWDPAAGAAAARRFLAF
ncbi:proteophosphoglycan 5 [Streptomyces sp. NBC_01481]|uniref:proteophosphoglycan 5 n=1 Tax=Streptomyces sp. NBC_01481 TaxID=2975869 RepID=UPI00225A344F|nr:proteophosphoglycan 5 [Streptomyces sp. NBC_01481]MCX4588166.1 proteophosphoglycan 5 [Streptomyces sp. NBC_01481]